MDDLQEDNAQYSVVMNAEEQYSIWPEGRDLPQAGRQRANPAPRPNASLISRKYGPTCGH